MIGAGYSNDLLGARMKCWILESWVHESKSGYLVEGGNMEVGYSNEGRVLGLGSRIHGCELQGLGFRA